MNTPTDDMDNRMGSWQSWNPTAYRQYMLRGQCVNTNVLIEEIICDAALRWRNTFDFV